MELNLIKRSDGLFEAADNETLKVLSNLPVNTPLKLKADKLEKRRTLTQNRALHKYCELLANELNERGMTQMKVLRHDAEVPWTMATVKDSLWKPLQKAMLDKESTSEGNTTDYSKVYEVLSRHLAMKLGVSVGWPNRFGD